MLKKKYLLVLIIFLMSGAAVSANSAAIIYSSATPAAEIITIDENCPLLVKNEWLTFDLSGAVRTDGYESTVSGHVNAVYEMENPTDQERKVTMAFPFISNKISLQGTSISSDGEDVPFDVYAQDGTWIYNSELFKNNPYEPTWEEFHQQGGRIPVSQNPDELPETVPKEALLKDIFAELNGGFPYKWENASGDVKGVLFSIDFSSKVNLEEIPSIRSPLSCHAGHAKGSVSAPPLPSCYVIDLQCSR